MGQAQRFCTLQDGETSSELIGVAVHVGNVDKRVNNAGSDSKLLEQRERTTKRQCRLGGASVSIQCVGQVPFAVCVAAEQARAPASQFTDIAQRALGATQTSGNVAVAAVAISQLPFELTGTSNKLFNWI